VGIGDTLADARRQAGLSITQVSQQTRIRESIIRAIEQGDFTACGGDFYARGHIRSIASVVGIDSAPLIRQYDEEHGPPAAMRASLVFEPATPIKIREPRRFGFGKVAAVLLLAVIGFGVYYLVADYHHHSNANATDTLHQGTPSASPPASHPAATPTATPAATPKPAHPEAVIRLTANQDCWVGLTDTTGKQLYQGTILAGKTMTWREKHQVSMVIGNPMGVVLTVNGKTQKTHTVQVLTLSINPTGKKLVAVGLRPAPVAVT
jgi:cytoskeletal protein RodZ